MDIDPHHWAMPPIPVPANNEHAIVWLPDGYGFQWSPYWGMWMCLYPLPPFEDMVSDIVSGHGMHGKQSPFYRP